MRPKVNILYLDKVRILGSPNMIKLVVAGGTPGAIGMFTGGLRASAIKKVSLPQN